MKEKYWVAFSSVEEIESLFIKKLYEYFGDIETAFFADLSEIYKIEGISKQKADKFVELRKNINVDEKYEEVLKRNINILTYDDDKYPYMLKNIYSPPMTLFYKGDLFGCNLDKTLAIVGSRRMTHNAKDALKKIMTGFAGTDLCVVSGLATGVDTVAHKFAIENNLKTIGVIACGFDFLYPASNKSLADEMINNCGAVVTEYYPTFQPLKFRFPQRNRIVSGLSFGTLIVEAALKSGALITANLTLEQGRELMCIPGLITNPNTEGIYKLLKSGATIVTSSEDVFEAMNWECETQISLFNNTDDINLTIDEKKILYTIDIEAKSFDEIKKETSIDTETLLMNLTTLELRGYIEQVFGDRYKKR